MEHPQKYIEDLESGKFPGDDGLHLYQEIIRSQFDEELEDKGWSLEKEMAKRGFNVVLEGEITPKKHQRNYFNPETKELRFKWKENYYQSVILPIEGEETYCFIVNNQDIIPIKDEKTMEKFLDLVLI